MVKVYENDPLMGEFGCNIFYNRLNIVLYFNIVKGTQIYEDIFVLKTSQ